MIQLIIDTESLTSQFDISKNQVDELVNYVVKHVAASYVRKLDYHAKQNLKSTRKRYLQNIRVWDSGRFKASIMLDYSQDKLIRMLEDGASAFDMKVGFEASSKKTIKKNGDGWYLTVPLFQGTPGVVGESDVFANVMPEEVHETAKKLEADDSGKSKGISLSDLQPKFQAKQTRQSITNPITHQTFKSYQHKSSIYEGISKRKDSVTGQNTYMSFRRVSDNSVPDSWIHTGITAYNLMDKALNDLDNNIEKEINVAQNNALNIMGF